MKRVLSPALLTPGWSNAIIAAAAAFIVWKLSQGFSQMNSAAAVITEPAGQLLSDISATANGWSPVEATQAGFILNSKYVSADGYINSTWRKAIEQSHSGNAALFDEISTGGKVKPQYLYLIGGLVSSATIKG